MAGNGGGTGGSVPGDGTGGGRRGERGEDELLEVGEEEVGLAGVEDLHAVEALPVE